MSHEAPHHPPHHHTIQGVAEREKGEEERGKERKKKIHSTRCWWTKIEEVRSRFGGVMLLLAFPGDVGGGSGGGGGGGFSNTCGKRLRIGHVILCGMRLEAFTDPLDERL